jgi:hypothetical protein
MGSGFFHDKTMTVDISRAVWLRMRVATNSAHTVVLRGSSANRWPFAGHFSWAFGAGRNSEHLTRFDFA